MKELGVDSSWNQREIKSQGLSAEEVDNMKAMAGSYEAIFSRRAMKYRSLGLNNMELSEKDYRKYIIQEYTFLKRPVVIIDDQIFVGNAKAQVQGAKSALEA
ncbi:MAG: hypothetical protein KTR13_06730 [Saprospiraceae bacterium]|nr:hypothetical protein [Saprospiraceae bacterium]